MTEPLEQLVTAENEKLTFKKIFKSSVDFAIDKSKRYWFPEVIAFATACYSAYILKNNYGVDSSIQIGYYTSIAETAAFYAVVIPRQIELDYKEARRLKQPYGPHQIQGTLLKLAVEFSLPELSDTPFVRPVCVAAGEKALGTAGVSIGMLAANVVFYLQSGIMNELIKRHPDTLGDGSLLFLSRKYIKKPMQNVYRRWTSPD